MAIGILNAAQSGLNAAQLGITTTGHNITNATTPGFNRQQVVQSTLTPLGTGAGFVGQGTQVTTIKRLYSDFLDNQVLTAQAEASHLGSYYDQIRQIDNMLADANSGLSPTLQSFFNALHNAANNPADPTSRQAVLNAGSALTTRFNSLDQRFAQMGDGVNSQITSSVSKINSYAQQIAQLNQKIVVAQAGSSGQPANDLLDQRDTLIANLNKEVKVTVLRQTDGTSNVFIGSGQALVLNTSAFALTTARSTLDPLRSQIAYASPGGPILLPESGFTGGSLGGLLTFRNETLEPARNALGRVALVFADSFNQQHQLGQDVTGSIGSAFFNIAGPQVTASSGNSGTAVVAATLVNAGALTGSDYRLFYNGSSYLLTRKSDGNQQTFATLPQVVDGMTISLGSGTPNASDEFLIRPTVAAAGSITSAISNAARVAVAAPIRSAQSSANAGSATINTGVVNGPPPANINLQQPVTFTFTSAGTFDVSGTGTGNPAGVAYTSGGNISYNGWTVQISGTPSAGDTFSVGPNTVGVADNRNALLLAGLQSAGLVAGGMTYQSAYSSLVGVIGNKSHELEITNAAQSALLEQTTAERESFSGVNLDEEAARLLQYQQAYQASAKVMSIAGKIFDSILQLG